MRTLDEKRAMNRERVKRYRTAKRTAYTAGKKNREYQARWREKHKESDDTQRQRNCGGSAEDECGVVDAEQAVTQKHEVQEAQGLDGGGRDGVGPGKGRGAAAGSLSEHYILDPDPEDCRTPQETRAQQRRQESALAKAVEFMAPQKQAPKGTAEGTAERKAETDLARLLKRRGVQIDFSDW